MFGDVWRNVSVQCMSDELRTLYPVVACPCVPAAREVFSMSGKWKRKITDLAYRSEGPCTHTQFNVAVNKAHIIQGLYCIAYLLFVTSRLYSALSVYSWMSGLRDYDE